MPRPERSRDAGGARRPRGGLGAVACVAAICLLAHAAAQAEDDRVESADAVEAAQARDANLVDLGANFDANVFDQRGDGWTIRGGVVRRRPAGLPTLPAADAGVSPTIGRGRRLGLARLERIGRICDLSPEQQEVLELAVESDVRRLAAEVDAQRRRYAGVTINMADQEGQRRWHQFQQDVQQCRRSMEDLFGERSLFAGAVETTLDAAQRAQLTTEIATRRAFQWRTMVSTVLLRVDDALGLDATQHRLLEQTLLAHEPRLRIDETSRRTNAHAEQMLIYSTLADVDPAPLQRALSERQWRALVTLMNQGRAMRSWLDQQGLVERPAPGP